MAFVQCICPKPVTIVDSHGELPRRSPAWGLWTELPRTSGPHTHQLPSDNSQKTTSPQSHISQAIHRSPCLTDPHTGHVPIRFRGSSIPLTGSKKSDPDSGETSVTVPQIQPPQIPCTYDLRSGVARYHWYGRMAIVSSAWLHSHSRVPYPIRLTKAGIPSPPRPAAGSLKPAHPTGLCIPRSNDVGWSGVGGDASTSGGGDYPALQARLGAGACISCGRNS